MTALRKHDLRELRRAATLVGVDEAGRGALAGPVVAAAVAVEKDFMLSRECRRECVRINDSKQLTPETRDTLFELLECWRESGRVRFAVASASVQEIGHRNILGATRLAMQRTLEALRDAGVGVPEADSDQPGLFGDASSSPQATVLVDGLPLKPFPFLHRGLVQGDSRSLSIAMASVLAKVSRDRMMCDLCREYPDYGFSRHKGYATDEHCAALRRCGPAPVHRALFLRKILGDGAASDSAAREVDLPL